MAKKGQVSTEMIVVIGLVLLIFIPLLTIVYFKATESNEELASYQAQLAVSRIAYLANSIGSLGTDTSIYTDIYLPEGTVSLETKKSGKAGELILTKKDGEATNEIVEVITYPIEINGEIVNQIENGNENGRWVRLKISSERVGDEVKISMVEVK